MTSQTIPEMDGERTSITLGSLAAGKTYFWRVRSISASNTGLATSPAASFTVGPDVTSGPYEMTIDASTASCGGLFAQPLVFDAPLTRTSGWFLPAAHSVQFLRSPLRRLFLPEGHAGPPHLLRRRPTA